MNVNALSPEPESEQVAFVIICGLSIQALYSSELKVLPARKTSVISMYLTTASWSLSRFGDTQDPELLSEVYPCRMFILLFISMGIFMF